MLHCLDFVRDFTQLSMIIRLSVAVICGGIIGIEREIKHRSAGFRTHILICMGAAITTLTSQYLYISASYYTDVARLGAQVIAGIGFIGAGAIIVTKQHTIRGLTTAAGLWCSAILGLACGAGFIEVAILGTLIIILAELVLIRLENMLVSNSSFCKFVVEYREAETLFDVLSLIREKGGTINNIEITKDDGNEGVAFMALISVRLNSSQSSLLPEKIAANPNVISTERI